MANGIKKVAALKDIDANFGFLGRALVKPGRSFSGGVDKWRQDFKSGKVKDRAAQAFFNDRESLIESHRSKGLTETQIAEKMIVDATLWASRISDEAMKQLYPEIEKRAARHKAST